MPTKYPPELKTRALPLLADHLENNPETGTYTACRNIGHRLGIGPSNPTKMAPTSQHPCQHSTRHHHRDMAAENRRLRKENAELRRANKILRTASA